MKKTEKHLPALGKKGAWLTIESFSRGGREREGRKKGSSQPPFANVFLQAFSE